ncbi:unnamed protein product [Rotaria sp. Silwood1]|nr:unnamed protein product [Rotaria sp. Silwood1]CAF1631710.1 unnamed protein product [Rotaria sp. Silwood1]
MKKTLGDSQKIRLEIIEEFHTRNLEAPVHMIDAIDRSKTSETNRNDAEHRKGLYHRLSEYLDHRQVRNRGQTYILPDLIHQLICSRFPSVEVNAQGKHCPQAERTCRGFGGGALCNSRCKQCGYGKGSCGGLGWQTCQCL